MVIGRGLMLYLGWRPCHSLRGNGRDEQQRADLPRDPADQQDHKEATEAKPNRATDEPHVRAD